MAAKPETRFIARVHKKLDKEVYREKTNNPYRGGTPDCYYEGPLDICWAEYKYLQRIPGVVDVRKLLSDLQYRWLDRATTNNKTTLVIVGCDGGGAILRHITPPLSKDDFIKRVIPVQSIADAIKLRVL